jgi:MFS family permease
MPIYSAIRKLLVFKDHNVGDILHVTHALTRQDSWLGGGFYVGYLVAQFPMGYLLGRYPAGRVLGVSCLIWGLVVLLSTQATNFGSAMAVRIALGMMEAVVTPGLNREWKEFMWP